MTAPAFVTSLARFGDRIALVDHRGTKLRYTALAERVDTLAKELGPDRHLVMVEVASTIPSVVAYLAALRGGHAVIVAKPGDVKAEGPIYSHFRPSRVHVAGSEGFSTVHDDDPELHPDLCALYSTSGSTGSAKLVRLSARNIDANADSIARYLEIDDKEIAPTTLPLSYSYGASILSSHLARGACVALTEYSVVDPEFEALFARERCTSLSGVPYTWELIEQVGFLNRRVAAPEDAHPGRRQDARQSRRAPRRLGEGSWGAAVRDVRADGMYGPHVVPALGAHARAFRLHRHRDSRRPIPPDRRRRADRRRPGRAGRARLYRAQRDDGLCQRPRRAGTPGRSGGALHGRSRRAQRARALSDRRPTQSLLEDPGTAHQSRRDRGDGPPGRGRGAGGRGQRRASGDLHPVRVGRRGRISRRRSQAVVGFRATPSSSSRPMERCRVCTAARSTTRRSSNVRGRSRRARETETAGLRDELAGLLGLPTLQDGESFSSLGGDSLTYIQASFAIERRLGHLPTEVGAALHRDARGLREWRDPRGLGRPRGRRRQVGSGGRRRHGRPACGRSRSRRSSTTIRGRPACR